MYLLPPRSMPKSQILHQIRYPLLTMTGTAFVVCVLHCLLGVPATLRSIA